MLDYSLNKDERHRFILFYEEVDDRLIVHYADNSTLTVENTDSVKENLNLIQEKQVRREYKQGLNVEGASILVGKKMLHMLGAELLVIGGVMIIFGQTSPIFDVVRYGFGTGYVLSTIPLVETTIRRRDLYKYRSFLKYKSDINEHIRQTEQANEIVDNNTNNPVIRERKVSNLCINDIHFMKSSKVMDMVSIVRADKRYNEIMSDRCQDIGIEAPQKLYRKIK